MNKIEAGAEAASILVGHVDFLSPSDGRLLVWCRLKSAVIVDELTEVLLPTRFVIIAVGHSQSTSIVELSEIGRATAALLNDKVDDAVELLPLYLYCG